MRWVAVRKYAPITVAGVTFNNANGSSRQQIIRGLEKGMKVRLLREPGNEHDQNAIAVLVTGQQIGYIPSELAAELATVLDDDRRDIHGEIADAKFFQPEDEPEPIWTASLSLVQYELREVRSGLAELLKMAAHLIAVAYAWAARVIRTAGPPLIQRGKNVSLSAMATVDSQLKRIAGSDATYHWILRGVVVALVIVLLLLLLSTIF